MDNFNLSRLLQKISSISASNINDSVIKYSTESIQRVSLGNIDNDDLQTDTTLLKHAIQLEEDLPADVMVNVLKNVCLPLFPLLDQLHNVITGNVLSIYKISIAKVALAEKEKILQIILSNIDLHNENAVIYSSNTSDEATSDADPGSSICANTVLDIISSYPELCLIDDEKLFKSLLHLLRQSSSDGVANKVLYAIFSKLLQQCMQTTLHRRLLDNIWMVVCDLFDDVDVSTSRSRAYTVLCGLSNWYLPVDGVSDLEAIWIVQEDKFWAIIQAGLYHVNPLKRKESLYMLKV